MSKSRGRAQGASGAPPTRKHLARAARERRQRRYLLIGAAVVAILVLGVIGFGVFDQVVLRPNQAVARVGQTNVTRSQFINAARFQQFQLVQQYAQVAQTAQFFGSDPQAASYFQQQEQQIQTQLSDSTTLGQTVVNGLVDAVLIRMEAARRAITVSPAEVQAAFQAFYAYYPAGTPTPTITPTVTATDIPPTIDATVVAFLTAQPLTPTPTLTPTATFTPTETSTPGPSPTATGTSAPGPTPTIYTTQGFATSVSGYEGTVSQQTGLSDADIRYLLESQLYRQKLDTALQAEVPTTADEVHARHILLADQATAQMVVDKLKAGGDWVALAAQYSTDTTNKNNGGDLGWFGKGDMAIEFETAAYSMTVGTISAPIHSQFGYHVIQVLAHGPHAVSATTLATQRSAALQTWLDAQRTKTMPNGQLLVQTFDNWSADVPTAPALPAPGLPAPAPTP